jgi:hypothetical protein
MGATYTRQSASAIVDGGVIEASDINAEFNQVLAAFAVTSGHTHDGTAAEGGPITKLLGTAITIGDATAGTDIAVTFDGESADGVLTWMEDEDYFQFSDDLLLTTTEKLQFRDTAIYINSSADGQLDLVADTEIQIAATTIDINGLVDISGNLSVGGNLDVTGSFDMSDANITNIGSIALDTITNDGTDITLDSSGDIILDAGGANVTIKDDGTSILDIANNSTDVEFTVSTADKNFKIKGTDGASAITALDIDMALAGKATFNGDVVVGGDLTVTGDDITMGTNTAGHLLIADGTNFNSIAATSLSEISTIANDDVFLAVDTSGGGLKKVARSTVVSGLATSAAISNVSEDTSPQLGGNLDMNGADIVTTSNANIDLIPNGTGIVNLDGTEVSDGLIELKTGTGNVAKVKFYCESSNAHAQTLQASPHSAGSSAVVVLPTTSGNLIGTGDTGTLPLAAIDIDGGTDIGAAIVDADLLIVDDGAGGTNRKTTAARLKTYFTSGISSAADDISAGDAAVNITTSSGNITIDAAANDSDIIFKGTDATSDITMLTLDGSAAGAATFNDKVIATELDISGNIDVDGTTNLDVVDIDGAVDMATTLQVDGAITTGGLLTAGAKIDLNGTELILDADADTSITADTDDTIDIRIAGADDFQFTANTFTIPSGSTVAIAAGGAITNAGTMSPDITSTGKALVFGF